MGDSKTTYSTTVSKVKQAAESNIVLANQLSSGKARAVKYGSGWDSVNINDIVDKFAPGATSYESHGKVFFDNGGQYVVVTDVAGGYLRIQDVTAGNYVYVTISGEYRPSSISKSKWKQKTHYRIKKLGEN